MSGELLTVTFAANETKPFQKAGRYFEVIADGGSTINVTFYGENGAVASNWNNIQSGIFIEDPWTQFTVTNNSASPQTLTFFLMDNGRGGSRRQPGVVSVIDGEKAKVANGQCFRGSQSVAGAAGKATIQLFNPLASGKNLFVQAIRLGSSGADAYAISTQTSTLPTGAAGIGNLRRSGAASVAALYTDNTGAAVTGNVQIAGGYVSASTDNVILFPRPVMLEPGQGVMAFLGLTANTMRINFEWEEWPTT